MKQHILFISCLFIAMSLQAQTPQNRTQATIIADALAQFPAENQKQYNSLLTDLTSTGEEGLLSLIGHLNPPGKDNNAAAEYAISGWTHFVANDPAKRTVAAGAYEKALQQPFDAEIKAFILRQLGKIGNDNTISSLTGFLNDERLSDPAAQALVSIRSGKAAQALLTALTTASSPEIKRHLVNALGETGYSPAEPALLTLLAQNSQDNNDRKVLYTALANTGTKQSVKALRTAAQEAGYAYTKDDATGAYVTLIARLASTDPKTAQKEASQLLKNAEKVNRQDLKTAATRILLSLPAGDKNAILKAALKDGDIAYLTTVLNAYPYEKDTKAGELIVKELNSQPSSGKQTAILYWLGQHAVTNALPAITAHLYASDKMVQKAAVRSLANIGTPEALTALGGLLTSDEQQTIGLAKQVLSEHTGDISYTLASMFDKSSTAGQIAALQLIAGRKMESQYNLVYNQLFKDNPTIKPEAARTLQHVVTDRNLNDLFLLLEQSDAAYTPDIQQALNAALSYLPAQQQWQLVTEKMNSSPNKHLYYSALANSRSQQALQQLIEAQKNETGATKQAALQALQQWPSFDVVYPLLDIARTGKDAEETGAVVQAIVQKVASSDKTGAVKYLFLREAMQFATNDTQKNAILRLLPNTGMYQAMLFAAPFMDRPALSESAAQAVMNLAINNPSFSGKITTDLLNKAGKTLNNPDADYQRQSIQKYLSEHPQEGGYVSLFNGRNLEGWKGLVENPLKRAQMSTRELTNAQVKADKQMAADWKVEDGLIVFDGKGFDNLCTAKQYGDFDMVIDWKLYPGAEPDAGIYLRGTPQVQIWDTARVNVGAQVGSGGLYNNQTHPSKPLKVADLKVGEWNTFRIRMVGDRVSVWLNGELVTDNVILENYWDRNQSIFPMEQIELQAHGSKVAYRDIYLRELDRPQPFTLSKEEEKEGFRMLFDGTNMHEWIGNTKDYVMEDGIIVMHPSKSFGGNLYSKDEFDNFALRFEFMLTPGANNGLGIRTPTEGDAAYVGMELQILDNEAPVYKDLQVYQYHGSVYGVIPAKRGFLKPTGEGNYQEVIADGDHIKVILNGNTIVDGNIREAAKNGTRDGKQHPGLFNKKGHIGFLGHGSEVKFKNIRIKQL